MTKCKKYVRTPKGYEPYEDVVPKKYRPEKPKDKHLPSQRRRRTKGVK